jgi:hypothetical protein
MLPLILPAFGAALASVTILLFFSAIHASVVFFTFAAIPLLFFGLRSSLDLFALSLGFAAILLLGFSSGLCLFFITIIAVPSLFFVLHIKHDHSIGWIVSDIALYALVLLAGVQWMLLDSGGIASIINTAFSMKEMSAVDPEMALQLTWLSKEGSFLLVGAAVWWAILLFYASAWLSCKLADHRLKTNFLNLAHITPFYPPIELLFALILCSILSLMPSENLAFIGKTGFVIILLPYCLSGAMYTPLRKWRGMQTGWIFLVIFLVMLFTWLAVLCATIGVWKHTEAVLRRT